MSLIILGSDDHRSKTIQFGKFTGTLFPEVYRIFVSELHKYHPDLLAAMEFAKVQFKDGSAQDFLNIFFNTAVTKDTPMEVGYAIFLNKLRQRQATRLAEQKALEIADKNFSVDTSDLFKYRSEENIGKPLFPSIEELKEKGFK